MAFLKYSLIRLALFVPLFAISYLFFQKQRDEATAAIRERFSGRAKPMRTAGEVDDAAAEDGLVEQNPDVSINTDKRPNA